MPIGAVLTIFQKMILVPVLSLVLYGSFITYSFFEHQQSNKKIKMLRDDYVPVMNLLNTNIRLFERLQETFKDTVLAQESSWLAEALELKTKLEFNLQSLESFAHIIDQRQLNKSKKDFNSYYFHANALTKKLLIQNDLFIPDNTAIQNVGYYLHLSKAHFKQMSLDVQKRFISTIDENTYQMNQLLFWGGIIAISSVLVLLLVTITISLSTRNSFASIVERTKLLASGDTDFSKRLKRPQRDELGIIIYWFNKLSDKLEEDYVKLEALSITDKLTQLNNRTRTDQFLPATIENAIMNKVSLVLVIIDIDHFKKVNDNFGHLVGDEVLKMFAEILKNSAKSGDYISRWGGEEFLLVWQNLNLAAAINKANDIKAIIEKTNFSTAGNITASIGLTLLTSKDGIESLISRADNNLYRAKNSGRNCVVADT